MSLRSMRSRDSLCILLCQCIGYNSIAIYLSIYIGVYAVHLITYMKIVFFTTISYI